jgi:hypothetical protein
MRQPRKLTPEKAISIKEYRKMAPKPTEHQEAVKLSGWLAARGIFFLHIPNEGKRSPIAGARLKREGMIPGAPDYLIFSMPNPDEPNVYNEQVGVVHGVAIELKRIGGRPTAEQLRFLKQLGNHGWITRICYGADDAITCLEVLGYGRRPE